MNRPSRQTALLGEVADGLYFKKYAKACLDGGYSVIPLYPGSKRPRDGLDWRDACWSRVRSDWVDAHALEHPNSGVGLACGRHMMAFDLDVENEDTIAVLQRTIESICGTTPLVRVGRTPKLALVYRAMEPIIGIRLPRFDILGLGTQLVGYGQHPDTGLCYRWVGETAPHLLSLNDVPGVTNADCVAVASTVVRMVYGDRFKGFVFDIDADLIVLDFSSVSNLTRMLLKSLFRGNCHARESFRSLIVNNQAPPGYWGHVMRPVVRGGFDHTKFKEQLSLNRLPGKA